MSAFVAIVNLDGTTIKPYTIENMAERLRYRGPDGLVTHIDEHVAFVYAHMRTTHFSRNETQPLTLNHVTLVGDVRLDSRIDLIRQLNHKGYVTSNEAPDSELFLKAYLIWGDELVQHVIGQFSAAVWDSRAAKMTAFRDHFGQQALYYAYVGKTFIVSNELSAIRLHPLVSSTLNDKAIADFLLFGSVVWIDKTFSVFEDIHRVSGGHIVRADAQHGVDTRRVWTLPTDQPMLRYRTEREYLEHYLDVLNTVMRDRLQAECVVVLMSGGLDSPSLAAIAQALINMGEVATKLSATTTVYEHIHDDDEVSYARLAADFIGIPLRLFAADGFPIIDPLPLYAEPIEAYEQGFYEAATRALLKQGNFVIYGEGADSLMRDEQLWDVLRRLPFGEAVSLYSWLWKYLGHRPYLTGLLPALNPRNWGQPSIPRPYDYPRWFNPDFEKTVDLRDRWEQGWVTKLNSEHRRRSLAYATLVAPDWTTEEEPLSPLDFCPPCITMPFLDLRMVNFMLSLPPVPWFKKKYLIRQAMQGKLPQEILQRPKTPLGTVLSSLLKQPGASWVNHWQATPALSAYIRRDLVPAITGESVKPGLAYVNMRPILLNNWLRFAMSIPLYTVRADGQ